MLQPLLMKEGLELPPVMTLLGQALFALVFGFMGLLLAVPLLATVMIPVKMLYVRDVVGDEVSVPGENESRLGRWLPARPLACSSRAAALLFSTGGAAIKAVDFTAWQITCLRSGIAARRDLPDDPRGPAAAGPGGRWWSGWPTRPRSRSSSSPTGSPPRRTRSISSPPRRSTWRCWRRGSCGSRPGGRTSCSWPRSRSGLGALLRRGGCAGGNGAGPGPGQHARARERALLGAHGVRPALDGIGDGGERGSAAAAVVGGERHRVLGGAALRAAVRQPHAPATGP